MTNSGLDPEVDVPKLLNDVKQLAEALVQASSSLKLDSLVMSTSEGSGSTMQF